MRQINIPERFFDLLKKAKIKIMIGGVLGAITLSGGTATISYAQSDNKSISSETDDNLENDDVIISSIEFNDDVTIDSNMNSNQYNDDVTINNLNLENDIKQNLSIDGYRLEDGICDIGVALLDGLNENVEYIYDLYMVDDLGNVIKQINNDVPFGTASVVREEGKYYAVVKEKETDKIYGTTSIIDTKNLQLGGEQIYEERSLTTITETGGALTGKWYDEYARNLSNKTGIDYEMIKDTIVNLHLDKIDETQIPVLYPEGINYTKLEESTDYILWNLSEFSDAKLYDFVAEKNDLEVLKVLDDKFLNMQETLGTTSYDCETIKECLNFFLAGGKINDITFEQLSDTGKKLALVGYDRLRDLIDTTYRHCVDNDVAIVDEYKKLYQITNSMNLLSVATYLEATPLISNYYSLVRECTDSNRLIAFDAANDLEQNVMRTVRKNNLKGLNVDDNVVKSAYFITNLDSLNQIETINNFNQNVDIHTEFANMEGYINAVLEHNATHDVSKNVSLVDISYETDKYDIAYLESLYKTLKFEMDNNKLNEKHAIATLRWVNEYYKGTYIGNPGVEVRYFDHFTNCGKFMANAMLNQYKILFNNYTTDNSYLANLIQDLKSVTLFNEIKGAEQIMYDNFEQLEQNLNYYTVKKGDTLSNIARMYNVNIFELVRLNNIENPDLILPGEKLKTNPQYNYDEEFSR